MVCPGVAITLYETLKGKGFEVAGILLTHGHFDHIWGSRKLRELSGAKIYAYEEEKAVCEDAVNNVSEQVCSVPFKPFPHFTCET